MHILFFLVFSFVKVYCFRSDSVETAGGSQRSQDGGENGHNQFQDVFPVDVLHDTFLSFSFNNVCTIV